MRTRGHQRLVFLALCGACSQASVEAEQARPLVGFEERSHGRFEAKVGFLRAELGVDGMLVQRGDAAIRLRFAAWGREGESSEVGPTQPRLATCVDGWLDKGCPRRVELSHPGVTETWDIVTGGIEQRWRVAERPSGDGFLVFDLSLDDETTRVAGANATSARLVDSRGNAWRYGGLAAWDANGRALAAWMETTPQGLRVVVDDWAAAYPVEIDPVMTEDTKLLALDNAFNYPQGSTSNFGMSVSSAGDVNGDGYDDVIVGAPWDPDLGDAAGAAYVFPGGPTGIQSEVAIKLRASDGARLDFFGHAVAGAGDVNGDGYDDVVVGAYQHGLDDSGAAYLYFGFSGGIDPSTEIKLTASDAVGDDAFGGSVAAAGDVDGDGFDDVIIGGSLNFGALPAAAYVYMGGSSQVDTEIKLTAPGGGPLDNFGADVAGIGDANCDGYDDVMVGAPERDGAGSAYLFYGAARDFPIDGATRLVASDGLVTDAFGISVAGAGDIDGDGCDDVLVGAGIGNRDRDAAYLFQGSPAGVDPSTETRFDNFVDQQTFGMSVSGVGDLDGDGFDDIAIGGMWVGAVYVYFGGANGVDADSQTMLESYLDFDNTPGEPGTSISGAGDVDGDGHDDLIVGDPLDSNFIGYNAGAAMIYHGACITPIWYPDADGDGYGNEEAAVLGCDMPFGYVDHGGDCDDTDPFTFPGSREFEDDGIDQDCNGSDLHLERGPRESENPQARPVSRPSGCGCSNDPGPATAVWPLLLAAMSIRRRRAEPIVWPALTR